MKNQWFRKVVESDLVTAYKCPCGAVLPPKQEFSHKLACPHSQADQGKGILMPDPRWLIVNTSHGPMILVGVEEPFDPTTGDFPRVLGSKSPEVKGI